MKLEAWQHGMDLFELVFKATENVPDSKLRSEARAGRRAVRRGEYI